MMIVLRQDCPLRDKAQITRLLEAHGVSIHVTETSGRTAFIVPALGGDDLAERIESHVSVEEVRRSATAYHLVTRERCPEATSFDVGTVTIGPGEFVVIAGPCTVESAEQIQETARCVAEAGAAMLRGGAFKPRTSPYSFQGMGERGLELLANAGNRYGLPLITEALAPEQVGLVAQYADVIQIGARNMQNFPLLRAAGEQTKPVFLKRSPMASIDEFLSAAEYIAAAGNARIMLCERGIRTFERATRNTLDISAVPVLKEITHLPVFVDPSHAVGKRELVPPMSKCAVACGADGLMVEVHPDPENAISDGRQSLSFGDFEAMMQQVRRMAQVEGRIVRRR